MGNDDHPDDLKRRHKEYVTVVFKEMLAQMQADSARNKMWNTKIKCGPDADAPLPPLAERMRQHRAKQLAALASPPPKNPPLPLIKRSRHVGPSEVVEFPTGRKITDRPS